MASSQSCSSCVKSGASAFREVSASGAASMISPVPEGSQLGLSPESVLGSLGGESFAGVSGSLEVSGSSEVSGLCEGVPAGSSFPSLSSAGGGGGEPEGEGGGCAVSFASGSGRRS